jgi:hypothetical protein
MAKPRVRQLSYLISTVLPDMLIETFTALHSQVSPIQVFPKVLPWFLGHIRPRLRIMLFNVIDNIQAHDIHQLKGPLLGFEYASEDGINLLWGSCALGRSEERLALDGSPNTELLVIPVGN